jgi:hypothetical protein
MMVGSGVFYNLQINNRGKNTAQMGRQRENSQGEDEHCLSSKDVTEFCKDGEETSTFCQLLFYRFTLTLLQVTHLCRLIGMQ